ncbi:MAG: DegT/DnrJ/EryC1/StrS family aminotransferase, partial [bacterium]
IAILQEKRKKIAHIYRSSFSRFPGIQLPGWEETDRECSYHLFPVLLSKVKNSESRALFLRLLAEEGVNASVHYRPVHLFSYYQKRFGYREGDFPVAEDVFRRIVSLPIYPSMSEEMVYQTIGAVARALQRFLP